LKKVTKVKESETDVIVHVKTSDGKDINTTMFHPFMTEKEDIREWKAASNLKKGDNLITETGESVYVEEVRVEKLAECVTVYNLEVEDLHVYYVAGVLVHNMCGSEVSGKKPSSKVLRDNMISSGQTEPSYKNAAHHIVAGSSPKAIEARQILQKYGLDINSADNGVFLPTEKGISDVAYHPSLHTNEYYRKVNALLERANSREDVIDILDMIRAGLLDGTF
ncbi:MAG: AHH domain-containing protein, partial [Lachnospiraceae bacterium]|nr:AHH domain-containing protein [Lachnospiraceae bacterium]